MAAAEESGFFDDWPKWSKPIFALAAMILLGGTWIGLPLMSAWRLVENSPQATDVNYQPMMAVLVAMTTATIAGIFLFMTFRIDRGTRLKAEKVAKDAAVKVVKGRLRKFDRKSKRKFEKFEQASKCKLDKYDEDAERKVEELTESDAIEEAVRSRIPEEDFRAYVEAVLLANANGQVVESFAKARAEAMDTKAVEALLGLLNNTVKHVAQCAKVKRKENRRRRWWEARERIVAGWRRAVTRRRD